LARLTCLLREAEFKNVLLMQRILGEHAFVLGVRSDRFQEWVFRVVTGNPWLHLTTLAPPLPPAPVRHIASGKPLQRSLFSALLKRELSSFMANRRTDVATILIEHEGRVIVSRNSYDYDTDVVHPLGFEVLSSSGLVSPVVWAETLRIFAHWSTSYMRHARVWHHVAVPEFEGELPLPFTQSVFHDGIISCLFPRMLMSGYDHEEFVAAVRLSSVCRAMRSYMRPFLMAYVGQDDTWCDDCNPLPRLHCEPVLSGSQVYTLTATASITCRMEFSRYFDVIHPLNVREPYSFVIFILNGRVLQFPPDDTLLISDSLLRMIRTRAVVEWMYDSAIARGLPFSLAVSRKGSTVVVKVVIDGFSHGYARHLLRTSLSLPSRRVCWDCSKD
jgi:hypothetical protein